MAGITITETTATPRVVAEDLADICDRTAAGLRAFSGQTVLVAGGAGFLPSYLADVLAWANRELLERPCRVVCLDNYVTGVATRLSHLQGRDDVTFVHADLSRGCDVDERIDYIVHGASIASPTWYRRHPLETIDVNVSGTRHLLDLARRHNVRGLLYLSSSEVYGNPPPDHVPTPEDYWGNVSCTGPRACYDESKRLAETLCATYEDQYGLPIKVGRPFNVYGPRLRLDDGRVVPDFLRNALDREPITIYSDGTVTRSFCYIADAAAAFLLLLAADGARGPFNVGNDQEVTIRTVAETMQEVAGNPAGVHLALSDDPRYLTDNPARRCPDLRRTKAAIDWAPAVDLRAGLARTLAFYREEPQWTSQ